MSRKRSRRNNAKPAPPNPAAEPFFKKAWFVVSAVGTLLAATLLNAPALLENARKLPASIELTKNQYLSWVYEDSDWKGNWSSFPEGVIDMKEMKLSNVDMKITIESAQGIIGGAISTKKICNAIPFFDYVLLRGEVEGDTALVTAYDYVEGESVDFAQLKLVREGHVITVTPIAGNTAWFPSEARLGRHPRADNAEPEYDTSFCDEEQKEFFKALEKAPN